MRSEFIQSGAAVYKFIFNPFAVTVYLTAQITHIDYVSGGDIANRRINGFKTVNRTAFSGIVAAYKPIIGFAGEKYTHFVYKRRRFGSNYISVFKIRIIGKINGIFTVFAAIGPGKRGVLIVLILVRRRAEFPYVIRLLICIG